MSESVLLVDYENVGRVDLAAIPSNVRVAVFFGASQRTVSTTFLEAALKLGERFVSIAVKGSGRNALDFHIAFYLGEYLAASPQTRCVILSNDKGFDPLILHLRGRKLSVRRVGSLSEVFAPSEASTKQGEDGSVLLEQATAWLSGMQKSKRPRKSKGLVAHLCSHFGKKIPESEIQKLVDNLIAERKISETDGTITYHL